MLIDAILFRRDDSASNYGCHSTTGLFQDYSKLFLSILILFLTFKNTLRPFMNFLSIISKSTNERNDVSSRRSGLTILERSFVS